MKKSTPDQQTPEDTDAEAPTKDRNLTVLRAADELPPVLAGHQTPEIRARAEGFYAGVAELFERWVARRPSPHTQRAYRRDVLSFVEFLGLPWPQEAFRLLLASVADVHSWRDSMMAEAEQNLIVLSAPDELPPVLAGHLTPQVRARTESFYSGVAELFERWVARRPSPHT